MSDVLSIESLDDAGRAALQRLILTLADSKRMMGIRYSDWLLGAPTVESGIAASSMCQDEWGHCRLLYAMLKGLGVDPGPIEHDRNDEEYASIGALDEQFPDWAAVVASMVIVDGALNTALESFSRGTLDQARSRVPKMLAEEKYHTALGNAWFPRLAGSTDEAKDLLRAATLHQLPIALAWLGASDEAAQAMVAAGVIEDGPTLVAAYKDSIRDVLATLDVDVDAVAPAEGWDSVRGRGLGQPDAESLERVRGDRNRSLLID